MDAAIPGDIDEADQPVLVIGAEMGKAARQDAGEIRRLRYAPGGGPERGEFVGRGEGVDADVWHGAVSGSGRAFLSVQSDRKCSRGHALQNTMR